MKDPPTAAIPTARQRPKLRRWMPDDTSDERWRLALEASKERTALNTSG